MCSRARARSFRAAALMAVASSLLSCAEEGPPPTHRFVLEERANPLAPGETLRSFMNAFESGAYAWQASLEGEVLLHQDCSTTPCAWSVVGIALDGTDAATGRIASLTSGSSTRPSTELDDGLEAGFLVPSGSIRASVRTELGGDGESARARMTTPSVLVLDPGSWLVELATSSTNGRRFVLVLYGRVEPIAP